MISEAFRWLSRLIASLFESWRTYGEEMLCCRPDLCGGCPCRPGSSGPQDPTPQAKRGGQTLASSVIHDMCARTVLCSTCAPAGAELPESEGPPPTEILEAGIFLAALLCGAAKSAGIEVA